jgi:hypothetical protein
MPVHRRWGASIILFLAAAGLTVSAGPADNSLRQLRFSPDGRYLLGQNEFEVTVLTVQPLAVLYRIPAENANLAQFTPDSRQIIFIGNGPRVDSRQVVLASPSARVERWSVADGTRAETTAIPLRNCETEELSPDGLSVACVDFDGTFQVLDSPSRELIFEKPKFGRQRTKWNESIWNPFPTAVGDPGSARIDFSADGRFLLAMAQNADGSPVGLDLHERRQVKLGGALKLPALYKEQHFAFVDNNRVMISPPLLRPLIVTGTLAEFPSGRVVARPKLPPNKLFRAADSRFVLVRPFGRYTRDDPDAKRAAAIEFSTGQVIISETPALDVFGDYVVGARPDGDVELFSQATGRKTTVSLKAH